MENYNQNDYELLYYLRKQVEEAQEKFLDKYTRFMWKIVHDTCYDKGNYNFALDDAYQEASWAFFDATNTYNDDLGVPFSAYLVKCVKNRVLLLVRKNQTKASQQLKYALSYDSPTSNEDQLALSEVMVSEQPQFDPQSYVQLMDVLAHVKSIVQTLSPYEQIVFMYRNIGYPYAQIAELTNTSSKQVDNTLNKIRKRWKEENEA